MHTFDNTEKLLTINELSQKLSIPKPTIRFWEQKMGEFVIPLRTNGGQRRYTLEHVSIVNNIKELREMGKSISEIKETLGKKHQKDAYFDHNDIESLSKRISEIVIREVSHFLKGKAV